MRMIRQVFINTAIVLFTLLFMTVLFEVGYRLITHAQAHNSYEPYEFWWVDRDIYRFDEATGYGYAPDTTARLTKTGADGVGLFANNISINAAGHVSTQPDEPAGDDVYTIALIGDSFTAGVYSPVPWGDLLETTLNEDAAFLENVGAQRVDVINYGREAIGIVQFAAIYEAEVRNISPDLVIVSFISEDVRRRFLWRGGVTVPLSGQDDVTVHLTCYRLPVALDNPYCRYGTVVLDQSFVADGGELDAFREALYFSDIQRRPWTAIYPEMVAGLIGRQIGLPPRLTRNDTAMRLFASDAQALTASRDALAEIAATAPALLVMHIPTHVELWDGALEPIGVQFIAQNSEYNIVPAAEFLPQTTDQGTIASWYNLPHDGHFSEIGAQLYADVVAEQVRLRASGQ